MNAQAVLLALVGATVLLPATLWLPGADSEPSMPAADTVPAAAQKAPDEPACCVRAALVDSTTAPARKVASGLPADDIVPALLAERRLAALLAELDAGNDDVSMVLALRDLLLAHPELAATFTGHVLAASRAEQGRMRLLQALQRSGDAGCQLALATIGTHATATPSLCEAALRALGSVQVPTEATLATLWSLVPSEFPAARTALLAFGQATAQLTVCEPDRHRRGCLRLQDELHRTTDAGRTGLLLTAFASTGSPDVAREALCLLGSPDPAVRARAACVLLRCDAPQVDAIAHDLLRSETDPEVRRIVVRGLALRARA